MRNAFLRHLALAAMALGMAGAAHAQVVISQVYGGGGNAGAPYNRDFVELYNRGSSPASLSGMALQYASATGTGNFAVGSMLPATSLAPGQYFLVGMGTAGANGVALPSADASGTSAMSGTAGKVVLTNSTAALACNGGSTPCSGTQTALILDLVGYGGANFFEGAAPTAVLGNAIAALRADGGCTDTNQNGADFAALAPAPRNSATIAPCGGGGLPMFTVADASADESAGSLFFVLKLNQPAGAGGASVQYATADRTALAGSDYVAASGTATFAEGADTVSLSISLLDDALTESDETFVLDFSGVSGAVLGDAQAQGTVVNDDVSLTPIHDLQGNGATSPLANQLVYTTGIVTGRKGNGFFLQTRDADADADPATSQGIYVFTSTAPPVAATVGNEVRVGGTLIEYVPSTDPNQLPLTEITGNPSVSLLSSGNPLPAPVPLTATFPDPAGPLDQLERLEGMRVTVASLTVAAPTEGNTSEANATGTSNGILHAVVTGVARPFREPGIQAPDPAPAGSSIPPIPRWDFNPELLTLDSDALGGPAFLLDLSAGAVIEGLTGPLDYGFRRYTIHRDPAVSISVSAGASPTAARAPSADEFTVAAYNLERFFDTVNDPGIGEPVLTVAAFGNRLSKASLAIRDFLHAPDILATVEVENLSTLQALAARINADAVAASQPDPGYVAYLEEGNDVGGIDVGFLVKGAEVGAGIARVEVLGVTQHGKDATWTEPNGSVSLLNDRPPLALDAVVHYADGRRFPVTVIAVHQRSLNDVDSVEVSGPTTLGDRVRRKRQAQAEYLAGVIQQMQLDAPSRRIVTLGDFNAFAFNDGLADTMNVVTGTPTADEQTAVPGDGIDLVDPDLVNLGVLEPQEERYSFVFGGNAQTLDHVLANEELVLASSAFGLDHARINADFPESARNDAGSPSRLSDHDPVVAYFEARHRADLAVSASAVAPSVSAGESIGFHASVSNLGPDAAIDTGVGFALDAELPGMAVVAPAGWDCDAAQVVDGATSIACHRDSLANGDSASFQLSAMTGAAQAGRTVTLAVAATSLSLDPASANDEATASVDVRALPTADLALQFSGPASVPVSAFSVVYSATLRNLGTAAAAQPVLVFDGNTMNATASLSAPAGWQCAKQGSNRETTFRCAAASLPAGTSAVFTLKVNAKPTPSDRTIRIGGTAGTVSPESDVSNNRGEHATRVQ